MEFIVTSKSYTIIKKKKEYSFYKLTSNEGCRIWKPNQRSDPVRGGTCR
ncbi:unnamed protein product [Tenebrio molitor]|nr:unnamed protein product [Tenebrio molitor]